MILLCLAQYAEGIIFVEQEGFCDADGELLLAEPDDSSPVLRTVEGNRQPEARVWSWRPWKQGSPAPLEVRSFAEVSRFWWRHAWP